MIFLSICAMILKSYLALDCKIENVVIIAREGKMNKIPLPYDDNSIQDIFRYSNNLIEKTFADVLSELFNCEELKEKINYYNNPKAKGGLGNLLEEHYFFYKPNSESAPDFGKVGMELKVTPYETNSKGLKAGERLVITMIPFDRPIEEKFKGSHLESKLKLILLIWYHRVKNQPRTLNRIDFVNLFDLYSDVFAKDLEIILDDYKTIVEKIITGNAHKISEGDTKYLGACTKGATADKSLQPQYYNNSVLAKRRAFSLKQSYMTYILNNYVHNGLLNYDSIFSEKDLQEGKFDEKVLAKINIHIGKSESELYKEFSIDITTNSKQINRTLTNRMLGVKTENAEEFEKANITIKTIRVQKNGKPRESMSFPKIVIKKFVEQDFENSFEYNFFESARFLLVVFKENDNGIYVLKGAKFWNMPINELDTVGKIEWESYKQKFLSGVNFEIKKQSTGKIVISNDLPNKKNHKMFHLRPHSNKSSYLINGIKYGEGTEKDMDLLPNGDKMTHQCFWLNNDYISEIIADI